MEAKRKASDYLRKNRSKTLAQTDSTVSVVIPAYNASRTIAETLESAINQTHQALEILVVDDGSSDSTSEIVEDYAARDGRVRLIRQINGGVAAARNAGITATSGEFIAPLDADDLWHSTKIARQVELFARNGPELGLVYTWFALIDERSRVKQLRHRPEHQGQVLAPLAFHNFIGNGSSALIRRTALAHTTGYDSSLRARGGQGCEDWKLYFEIAERYSFGLVPQPLTGYRDLADNMSSDVLQMLRSRDLCTLDLLPRHPDLARAFRTGRNRLSRFLFHRAIRRGRIDEITKLALSIGRHDPVYLARLLATLPLAAYEGITGRVFGSKDYQGRDMIRFADFNPS
ncbi:glycosyltransferase family 2 protein [Rhizorhapis suberifaciens]|uniref:Glycosyltransferase involved in cell wall biosynthesis n=1 Tax=Rhizorhapis suberifaciens TaxID=13656 RepID=A0A840HVJ9_9SPHN|nr:glycosyltransferase family A protein [Rhizorhapis suberifaciens]MBB4641619.1 glycosyltransferase involved in cell wall biosynthesis [Rhizorhapis suberifaciens]